MLPPVMLNLLCHLQIYSSIISEMETQVRRRKASPGGDANLQASQDANGSAGRSSKIDSAFTYLVVLVLVVILSCLAVAKLIPDHPVSLGLNFLLDFSLNTLGLCPAVYAVVIDAGSTGSRVLAFTFHQNPVTGNLVLDDELWQEVKPGLSSFASNPEAGADTITTLLSLHYVMLLGLNVPEKIEVSRKWLEVFIWLHFCM